MGRSPDRATWAGDRLRRGRALVLTGAVHALVLTIVLFPAGAVSPPRKAPNLVAFDSSLPGPSVQSAPRPRQPRKVPPPPPEVVAVPPPLVEMPIVTPQVVALLEQADAQAASGGCDLTGPVQAALQSSVTVQQQLPTVPIERRSVANAVAIWNQTWVEPDAQLTPEVLDSIRVTVATTIAAASEACRLQPQGGPRLVYLPGKTDTTVLALGSGQWTWQQIADSAQPEFLARLAGGPVPAATLTVDADRSAMGLSQRVRTVFSQ